MTNKENSYYFLKGYLLALNADEQAKRALDDLYGEKQENATDAPPVAADNPAKGVLVKNLPLSVRNLNCLANEDVKTLGDVCKLNASDLLKIPNFGRKSLCELYKVLSEYGLGFKCGSVFKIPNPDVYITVFYEDLVPFIKQKKYEGMNATQIREIVPGGRYGRPCTPTIQSIMDSKMYQEAS